MNPMLQLDRIKRSIRLSHTQAAVAVRIGENIKYYRTKRKLSQRALAEALGVKQPTIARMERQDYHRYTVTSLVRVAFVLNIDVARLVQKRVDKKDKV